MQVREAAKVRSRQTTWYVQSESDSMVDYIVHNKRNDISHHKVWTCNCPDFTERQIWRNGQCKHISAVQTFVSLQAAAAAVSTASEPKLTVKQVLDLVVKTLKGPREQAKQLWDIMTILRGPDSDIGDLKAITTASIRGAIGLNQNNVGAITNNANPFGADLELTSGSAGYYELSDKLRKQFGEKAQFHFISHYRAALVALKQLGYIK